MASGISRPHFLTCLAWPGLTWPDLARPVHGSAGVCCVSFCCSKRFVLVVCRSRSGCEVFLEAVAAGLIWHCARACLRAMISLALRVCVCVCASKILQTSKCNTRISRGVFTTSEIAFSPPVALTFVCASRLRWRCYFQLLRPLYWNIVVFFLHAPPFIVFL